MSGETDSATGENPWWCTPAHLLDCIEQDIRRLYLDEGGADPEHQAELLLCLHLPSLRGALRDAGLDIPPHGPHSAFREEWAAWKAAEAAKAEDCRETALYRWWDEADILLYIGVAGDLGSRTKGHVKGSSWMEFVARSAVERHPTRGAALAAETAAIKAEHPLFNFQHNNTPEARRRLVEYLIEHGRLDMLAPVVSRG
jgi:predicted GIY-YIG superfamily endonuclease